MLPMTMTMMMTMMVTTTGDLDQFSLFMKEGQVRKKQSQDSQRLPQEDSVNLLGHHGPRIVVREKLRKPPGQTELLRKGDPKRPGAVMPRCLLLLSMLAIVRMGQGDFADG